MKENRVIGNASYSLCAPEQNTTFILIDSKSSLNNTL